MNGITLELLRRSPSRSQLMGGGSSELASALVSHRHQLCTTCANPRSVRRSGFCRGPLQRLIHVRAPTFRLQLLWGSHVGNRKLPFISLTSFISLYFTILTSLQAEALVTRHGSIPVIRPDKASFLRGSYPASGCAILLMLYLQRTVLGAQLTRTCFVQ